MPQNSNMKTATKVLLVLFVITSIPAIFLGRYLFSAIIPVENGFEFSFDTYAYIALAFVVVSSVLGGVLYFKFISSLKLSKAIFFSIFPLTVLYGFGLYSLASVNLFDGSVASVVKQTLNISEGNNYNSILWAVLLTIAYLGFVFLSIVIVCRPMQKVEKIAVRLGDGRVKEGNFNIGGIKQFQGIETALEKINYNYREKEQLVKKTDIEAQKFIPKEFLKFLGKNSITELELGNKVQKRATTLFCDFVSVGGDSLSLKDNFNYVNSYMSLISPIVRKFGGFIDKYLGNGLLAVFGKAEMAIDCGNAICREVQRKNSSQTKFPNLDIKISINTGDIMFGIVGEEERKSPTIVSEVVNLASKMQEINSYLGTTILFSKQTLNELPTRFSFDYRYVGSLTIESGASMAMFEDLSNYDRVKREKLLKIKTFFENGVRAYNDKDFEEARDFFEECLRFVPNDRASFVYYNKSSEKLCNRKTK